MQEADEALALQVLGWILTDEPRAERLLGMTGLTPAALRESLGQRATLAAILGFLTAHEPDLVACAGALDIEPEALAAAARRLEGDERTMA
ncbi:DUF3572 family protein [Sphingopyxis macrogoltabida]|uniref:DUF3572 domain-containing protein n=1 Tax=Sphingopyxis macrogoltabida TaxID=33050 RepID=A0AAC9FH73_SPHMC|nr:DUF3572 family protein [Sphingopyxis macrogoltabida]ALJ16079.1 hypothetical protein LH19_24640 [Sphingopyxis macrogoltabida]AMU92318.1 hypothetical protein ATM17_25200 [Sphingopyxis macrogoltabida]